VTDCLVLPKLLHTTTGCGGGLANQGTCTLECAAGYRKVDNGYVWTCISGTPVLGVGYCAAGAGAISNTVRISLKFAPGSVLAQTWNSNKRQFEIDLATDLSFVLSVSEYRVILVSLTIADDKDMVDVVVDVQPTQDGLFQGEATAVQAALQAQLVSSGSPLLNGIVTSSLSTSQTVMAENIGVLKCNSGQWVTDKCLEYEDDIGKGGIAAVVIVTLLLTLLVGFCLYRTKVSPKKDVAPAKKAAVSV
jgi:hypothetical protein